MRNLKHLLFLSFLAYSLCNITAQTTSRGYYKDVFMDSGIMLTSRTDLPAARLLNLSMESFVSTPHSYTKAYSFTHADTLLQTQLISGSDMDQNGILLYPDGQPRFRMVYMNGGRAASHGRSLGEEGRNSYRNFVKSGGSYLGSCAGAFIASKGSMGDTLKLRTEYTGIWPGIAGSTGLEGSYTHMFIEPQSPLLKYYDFGGDMRVDSVRHNGGCYAYTQLDWPQGTEILARFDTEDRKLKRNIHQQASIWAYKENGNTGRIVLCGSHPEEVTRGERLELMSAMILYALDGVGAPVIKGELINGEERKMSCSTADANPNFTRIGDKQYHHFTVQVPSGVDSLKISLKSIPGWQDFDLYLLADNEQLAYKENAHFQDVTLGIDKVITIPHPQVGTLYVSVFCDTTVDAVQTKYGTQYSGRTDVLNGVPYILKAEW